MIAAAVATLLRLATIGYPWSFGWEAAADLVWLAVPPLLVAAVLAPVHPRVPSWRRTAAVVAAGLHVLATFTPHAEPYAPTLAAEAAVLTIVLVVLAGSGAAFAWSSSRLPGSLSMAGAHAAHGPSDNSGAGGVDISSLTGPREAVPDRRFTLTARTASVRLVSGEIVAAWTFNGRLPGPELRVRQGDLVEVTLVNQNVAAGVTVHWHGVDVPNAEDGSPGSPRTPSGREDDMSTVSLPGSPACSGTTPTSRPTSRSGAACSARSSSNHAPSNHAPGRRRGLIWR
ncbi:hypothetical protein GCM10027569_92400 [Flindersiella endophytica]